MKQGHTVQERPGRHRGRWVAAWRNLALAAALLLAAGAAGADAAERKWTNRAGRTIVAELEAVEGTTVVLKRRGRVYRLELAELSDADQVYARQWAKEMAAKTKGEGGEGAEAAATAPPAPTAPPPGGLVLAGTLVRPGKRQEMDVQLTRKWARKVTSSNPRYTHARFAIAVPEDFDPEGVYPVLVISATQDGSNVTDQWGYWEAGVQTGFIVVAADGAGEKPKEDHNDYRWGTVEAGLAAMAEAWPAAAQWPLAFAGFSGGAKRSGSLAAMAAAEDHRVIGIFMGGCNEDYASVGLGRYGPRRSKFLRVPIYVSNGTDDDISTVAHAKSLVNKLKLSGFKEIQDNFYDGGHSLHRPHVKEALEWFVAEAGLKGDGAAPEGR